MKKSVSKIFVHSFLIISCIITIIPVTLLILSSFNASSSIASSQLIPSEFTFDNYIKLFTDTPYVQWFFNTLNIAVISTVLSVLVVLITAWIMSRFKFTGKKTALTSILLLSMFPTFLSMTAIYALFLILGLIGSPISIIIIYIAGAIPYNTWLVKGYLDGISMSMDEAAYLDGCNRFQTFTKIILPMSKPIITYCAVSQFMIPWMDYILPSMLLSKDSQKTLAVGLFEFIARPQDSQTTMFAAGAVLIAVPITILFMVFQKFLVKGISAGADK